MLGGTQEVPVTQQLEQYVLDKFNELITAKNFVTEQSQQQYVNEKFNELIATNNLNSSIKNYSLSEQWTGKYWIDGKKIYQRTIAFGMLPNNAGRDLAHNISNISYVVNVEGMASDGSVWVPLPRAGGDVYTVDILGTKQNVAIYTTSAVYVSYNAYITLYYTCTNR